MQESVWGETPKVALEGLAPTAHRRASFRNLPRRELTTSQLAREAATTHGERTDTSSWSQ